MTGILLVFLAGAFAAAPIDPDAEATPLSRALTSEGFKKIGEEGDVTVFRNHDRSTISLAAEGRFDAPPDRVLDLIVDYPSHVGVVDNVKESRILASGSNWALVYERLDLPVISNRDYTLLVKWGRDGDALWATFDAVTDRGPPPGDAVRVTHNHGSWQLTPVRGDDQSTDARFQVSIDFGGMVPMWMVTKGAADKLPALFEAFEKVLAEGR